MDIYPFILHSVSNQQRFQVVMIRTIINAALVIIIRAQNVARYRNLSAVVVSYKIVKQAIYHNQH